MERHFRITVDGIPYAVTVEELADGAPSQELHAAPPLPQPASASAPAPGPAAAHVAPHAAAPQAPAPGLGAMPPASAGEVLATLGGVVESVAVTVGQAVHKGDVVLVLEAMKMNSPMVATRSGTITGLLVQPGDAVQAGQLLARIG